MAPVIDIEEFSNQQLFKEDEVVVAKWEEDNVWYNSKIETVFKEGYLVLFTDYGNTARVNDDIVKSAAEIPALPQSYLMNA